MKVLVINTNPNEKIVFFAHIYKADVHDFKCSLYEKISIFSSGRIPPQTTSPDNQKFQRKENLLYCIGGLEGFRAANKRNNAGKIRQRKRPKKTKKTAVWRWIPFIKKLDTSQIRHSQWFCKWTQTGFGFVHLFFFSLQFLFARGPYNYVPFHPYRFKIRLLFCLLVDCAAAKREIRDSRYLIIVFGIA